MKDQSRSHVPRMSDYAGDSNHLLAV